MVIYLVVEVARPADKNGDDPPEHLHHSRPQCLVAYLTPRHVQLPMPMPGCHSDGDSIYFNQLKLGNARFWHKLAIASNIV